MWNFINWEQEYPVERWLILEHDLFSREARSFLLADWIFELLVEERFGRLKK